jgi:hypothetical protein
MVIAHASRKEIGVRDAITLSPCWIVYVYASTINRSKGANYTRIV